eukprot:374022_1
MAQYPHSIHLHYVPVIVIVFIMLLFKKYKAQCLSAAGSCNQNILYRSLPSQGIGPPHSFIQTFNVSSCVSDHRLEISVISIWYQYYISS